MRNSDQVAMAITERQILHIYLDHIEYLDEGVEQYFNSPEAKKVFTLFKYLKNNSLSFINEHFLKYGGSTSNILDLVSYVTQASYQLEQYPEYIKELQKFNIYDNLENSLLQNILLEVSRKGPKDISTLAQYADELNGAVATLNDIDSPKSKVGEGYKDFSGLIADHKEVIRDRQSQIKQSTGCSVFDQIMPQLIPGIGILAGYSGSAKSTFVHYLERQRIIKRLPTIVVNTELSKIGYMDGMLPSFIKTSYFDLLGLNREGSLTDYGKVLQDMSAVEYRFSNNKNFLYYDGYACSLKNLTTFINDARLSMNLAPNRVLFCCVDLLSMLTDFNSSKSGYNKAEVITTGMDLLNAVCLETNTFLLGTVQLKRNDEHIHINTIEDVEAFRPTIDDIKSSGAYEERARFVMTIFNKWSIVHRNPCVPAVRDIVDPVVDITLNKDSYYQQTGKTIQYLFQSDYKTFAPYGEITYRSKQIIDDDTF